MSGSWSATIDPIQLADQGARLDGELPIKGLPRLAEACLDEDGSVRVELRFERGTVDGLRVMQGSIVARVHLTCQRCMNPMALELRSEPRLFLLRPGEREDLLETGDALVVEQPVALGTLIEDELLLELPMVPMHPEERCAARGAGTKPGTGGARPNPFSVLQKLKRTDP